MDVRLVVEKGRRPGRKQAGAKARRAQFDPWRPCSLRAHVTEATVLSKGTCRAAGWSETRTG
jgi:hypothetical protein